MRRTVGIDLGTTLSSVAVIEGGKPKIIPNAEGDRLTPSVIAIDKKGERLVGLLAKQQAITNPDNTIFSVKRLMGRKFKDSEVQYDIEHLPYKIVEASNGDVWVVMGGKQYSPLEISAMILQKLKIDAEAYLGEKVTDAVVTVPAYFNDCQRQATKDAGTIAGLNVIRIINEPTAAALAYGLDKKQEETVAILHFGGGTFDVSILELSVESGRQFMVKSTNGDTHLGGDGIDQRIIDWLSDEFRNKSGIDLIDDKMALQRLRDAAEKAKRELSTVSQTEINLPFITADASGPKHMNITLKRARLEQLSLDLLEKTIGPCRQALNDAGLTSAQVSDVILVGGQTRMPKFQDMVRQFFGKEPFKGVNPDELVALGAAIQAGVLKSDVRGVLLLDVTPLTLSIETRGGVVTPLIPRNTTIPTRRSQIFSTDRDDQPTFEIHILQGERPMAADNLSLARIELRGILPAPRGVPQIEVTFDINTNGIFEVRAQDKGTGEEQKITITASSGLGKDEVEKMKRDAEAHAAEDARKKEEVETRNTADTLVYTAERTLREQGDKIPADLKQQLEGKIAAVRSALQGTDTNYVRNTTEELSQTMQKIGAAVYGHAGAPPPPGGEAPGGEEDTLEVQNVPEGLAYIAEQTLREQWGKIPADLKQQLESKIAAQHSALQGTDMGHVLRTTKELSQLMREIRAAYGYRGYRRAGAPPPPGGEAPGGPLPGGEEGTVEGEFREV